ncbi:hypothetical protein ACRXCV_14805 [Halobacteriovorax sp. GFR7]|uniref:hypothetical protein n=1 Tax=unclassified Halobacteriovorax TaxID=2639665 RepID=UPI0037125488
MKTKILALFALFLLTSCGNMTKNFVKSGESIIKGGTAGGKPWNEALTFQRLSWYSELNLMYDVFFTKMDPSSPFWQWFSESESRRLKECKAVYVSITFSLDSDRISHAMFYNQVLSKELQPVVTNDFDLAIANHPDFNKFFLSLYKSKTLCATSDIGDLKIKFPNFKTRTLHF